MGKIRNTGVTLAIVGVLVGSGYLIYKNTENLNNLRDQVLIKADINHDGYVVAGEWFKVFDKIGKADRYNNRNPRHHPFQALSKKDLEKYLQSK